MLRYLRIRLWVVLLSLVFVVPSTFAQDHFHHSDPDYTKPRILSETDFSFPKDFSRKPPKPGSSEEKKDLKTLHEWQKNRSQEICDAGDRVSTINTQTMFGQPDGPLSAEEVKTLDALIDAVRIDVGYFAEIVKNAYKRPRPFIHDSSVIPCAKKPHNYSYLSGHSAMAYAMGTVLSKWDPKRKVAFMKRADEIADGRFKVGIHYPSDVRDGKAFGKLIAEKLFKNEKFMKMFKALPKAETKKH